MAEEKTRRLKQVATTLNIGTSIIVDYLSAKGFDVENKPTSKITAEQFGMLAKEFASSVHDKQKAEELNIGKKPQSNQVVESWKVNCEVPERSLEEDIVSHFGSLFISQDTIAELKDKFLLHYSGLFATKDKNTYKISRVASALNTSTSVLFALLEKHGYYLDKKTNPKLTEAQLRLLTDHFAVQIDIAIARSGAWFEPDLELCAGEYDLLIDRRLAQKASDERFLYIHCEAKKKISKVSLQDIKSRIHSILTPKLFHVFSGDEDGRAAKQDFGFSAAGINRTREACSNFLSFKTRFFHETITQTY